MQTTLRAWCFLLAALPLTSAVLGVERSSEMRSGEIALFDGRSLDAWTTAEGEPVAKGWQIKNGELVRTERGGAIYAENPWNHSRIVVRGNHIEHWLNGRMVVQADTSSDEWRQRVAGSKFADVECFAQNPKGRIQIQDHGSKVWFRKILLRPLGSDGS
jgi:hypothetical protein